MSQNIAVIPARGSSKRLPYKNIIDFMGTPIIHYTIKAALQSSLFDVTVVSTEDDKVKSVVDGMGCEIHHRSPALATDTSRVVEVLKDVLCHYNKDDKKYDYLCCLYPTAPLLKVEDIRKSYRLMISKNADYCQAVTEYRISPFFAFNLKEDNSIERRWPNLAKLSPRKKPRVVVDNGSMYWAKVTAFIEKGELHGENTMGYLMPSQRSIDIDTEDDLILAEFHAKTLKCL